MTRWVFFYMRRMPGAPMDSPRAAICFRHHFGTFIDKVQLSVVNSMRREVRKYHDGVQPGDTIVAYPLTGHTPHASDRWVDDSSVVYLWNESDGLSHMGYWL